MGLKETVEAASQAIHNDNVAETIRLSAIAEIEIASEQSGSLRVWASGMLGGIYVDAGQMLRDTEMIAKGAALLDNYLYTLPEEYRSAHVFYNAANGQLALWECNASSSINDGCINEHFRMAILYFRLAIWKARDDSTIDDNLKTQILINYANCLDSIGRCVEAVKYYDQAIEINPSKGEALGNKGITLHNLAHLAHGYTHRFLLEAHRLLKKALNVPLSNEMRNSFQKHYDDIQSLISNHGGKIEPEIVDSNEPKSDFHSFMQTFCYDNHLFLTPATFTGDSQEPVFSDPLFVSYMVVPIDDTAKFNKYTAFVNEIKHDYIVARYLLIQSIYRSDTVDAIDQGVNLYYSSDNTLNSSYIHLLKTAMKLVVDIIDKIGYFFYDYCEITSMTPKQVYFRSVFPKDSTSLELRKELKIQNNIFIFALFSLAVEMRDEKQNDGRTVKGAYSFLYERRNALTHRITTVHDAMPSNVSSSDGIERILLDDLFDDTLFALQIVRSALIYPILFIDTEEKSKSTTGNYLTQKPIPIDETIRWIPPFGDAPAA